MPKLQILFLCCLCIALSGCFELIEEVTYSDKEKGSFLLTLNCSKSKSKLKALMKLDTFMGVDIPSEYDVRHFFQDGEITLRNIQGISKVQTARDFENFIFTVSFDFDKTETLNKAINAIAKSVSKKKTIPLMNVYKYENGIFERMKTPGDSINKLNGRENAQLKLLSGATATSIYRFAQPVKKSSNKKAVVSKSGKAVMLKQNITEIVNNPIIYTNTISF